MTTDGITVFHTASIADTYQTITVRLESFLFWKYLAAAGDETAPHSL